MRPRHDLKLLAALAALLAGPALAGSFGVAPTRIDLGNGTRSSLLEVTNDDTRKLSFQVRLASWTQDPAGKDGYADSQDLIFFPPLFTVNAGDKRVIRVGLKGGEAPAAEVAYRLYIEEIPEPTAASSGSEVKVVLRFGVPVFVAPAKPRRAFVLDDVALQPGKATFRIRNDGNQSAKFETLKLVQGSRTLAEATGWYVLPGATRAFDIPVEREKCVASGTLEVQAQADGVALKRDVAAAPALCARP